MARPTPRSETGTRGFTITWGRRLWLNPAETPVAYLALRETEIAKVPLSAACHCGPGSGPGLQHPQSMVPTAWMPGQARHDNGTLAISVSLNESLCVLADPTNPWPDGCHGRVATWGPVWAPAVPTLGATDKLKSLGWVYAISLSSTKTSVAAIATNTTMPASEREVLTTKDHGGLGGAYFASGDASAASVACVGTKSARRTGRFPSHWHLKCSQRNR